MKTSNTLTAQERSGSGKGAARKIRAAGACPAVLYGPGTEPRLLTVDPKEFMKLLSSAGESSLIDLEVTGIGDKAAPSEKVIIRDLQYPPMGDLPSHVDFYRVSLDRSITITVPLEVTGTCEALENKAGTLSQQTHQLSVECLPTNIPSNIEVDISGLEVGGSLHVRDLVLPEGVTSPDNPDLAIVSINVMKEEEVVEEVEEAAPELESTEPEVIGQDKGEEKPES